MIKHYHINYISTINQKFNNIINNIIEHNKYNLFLIQTNYNYPVYRLTDYFIIEIIYDTGKFILSKCAWYYDFNNNQIILIEWTNKEDYNPTIDLLTQDELKNIYKNIKLISITKIDLI